MLALRQIESFDTYQNFKKQRKRLCSHFVFVFRRMIKEVVLFEDSMISSILALYRW